ncbi:TVP38/TMEM64 family protein [bacterium]|nr:TVP38/TMEM64 family protein [bacterium]
MKKKGLKRLVIVLFFVGIMIAFSQLNIENYFSLEALGKKAEILLSFVKHNYIISVFLYLILYSVIMALSLPVAGVMTIAGGFLFGSIKGALFANIGATIGSVILFLLVRFFSIKGDIKESYGKRLKNFVKEFESYGYMYLLSIRLIIVFPPFVATVLAGLADVSLKTFIWTTSLGMIPGSLVYAFAGRQLSTLRSVQDVLSFNVIVAITLLFVLSIIPLVVRFIRHKKRVA